MTLFYKEKSLISNVCFWKVFEDVKFLRFKLELILSSNKLIFFIVSNERIENLHRS